MSPLRLKAATSIQKLERGKDKPRLAGISMKSAPKSHLSQEGIRPKSTKTLPFAQVCVCAGGCERVREREKDTDRTLAGQFDETNFKIQQIRSL